MEHVLLESVKEPRVTQRVAPAFADILVTLGLYRRVETAAPPAAAVQPAELEAPEELVAPPPRRPRQRRRASPDPEAES